MVDLCQGDSTISHKAGLYKAVRDGKQGTSVINVVCVPDKKEERTADSKLQRFGNNIKCLLCAMVIEMTPTNL
jgi:hypothetical protein